MTYWVVSHHLVYGHFGGGTSVATTDVNQNRIPADENTQNLETGIQTVTAKTVFTTSSVSIIYVNCS